MRICCCLVTLAFAAFAEEGVVTDDEMAPFVRDQFRRFQEVIQKTLTIEDFLKMYPPPSVPPATPREAAKAAFLCANALQLPRRLDQAQVQYDAAYRHFARFPLLLDKLAEMCLMRGDAAGARRYVEEALKVDPNYAAAYIRLGMLAERESKLLDARDFYRKASSLQPNAISLRRLASVCILLWGTNYNEREKAELAEEALVASENWLALEPLNGETYVHLAAVQARLGRMAEALKTLEEATRAQIRDAWKLRALEMLLGLYGEAGDLKKVEETLTRLMAYGDTLPASERDRLQRLLNNLKAYGAVSFKIYEIERLIDELSNEGNSLADRRNALREILRHYEDGFGREQPELRELHHRAFGAIVRAVTNAPAPLVSDLLVHFREKAPDPRLASIVVFFLYPYDDEQRTPAVRVEAVRTLAGIAEMAAIPILLHCTRDDAADVLREVDKALSRLTGVRSPIGEGIAPVTPEERTTLRRAWTAWAHGEEGGRKLAEAFRALRAIVPMEAAETRANQQSAPIAEHARSIVSDGDVPLEAWLEAFGFLRDYLGREFRPVDRRDKPVEPSEREAITKAVEEFFRGSGALTPADSGKQ